MAERLYNLESAVNTVLRLDPPVPMGRLTSSSRHEAMVNASSNSAFKTPSKKLINGSHGTTPSNTKTPGSAGRKRTPGRSSRTPSSVDRFIPRRSDKQFELAHFLITQQKSEEELAKMSPSQLEYRRIMNENLNGDLLSSKILQFKERPPQTSGSNSNRVLYSGMKVQNSSTKKTTRHIPQVPEKILDAPDLLDDFYLRLIDWSKQNVLAVALGSTMYLWHAIRGEITPLMETQGQDYVSSVLYTPEGNHLALGMSTGTVELWDTVQKKKLRTMGGHAARVGSLSWNSHVLSSGSRSGAIHHHDVRVANHHVATLQGHTQEVCGLQWSPTGAYLASGGNDNLVNIWRAGAGSALTDTRPMYTFNQHQAAVKALAWCPWQRNVLASGGGTADRRICTWNCSNGNNLQSVDTQSQVSALLWSEEHKELLSAHGFSQNQIILWKYPAMTKVTELKGHTSRILHVVLSPDGNTVVSAGADETLRIWKCFQVDEKLKKSNAISRQKQLEVSSLRYHMR